MATTLEEMDRKYRQEIISGLTLDQRLAGVSAEEIRKRVPAEDLLRGMPRRELAMEFLRENLQREPTLDEIDAFLNSVKRK